MRAFPLALVAVDHSRVRLGHGDNDYINASLVEMAAVKRRYILTQGPLPSTCGHFWQMVFEADSKAIVMLNRVIEKGVVRSGSLRDLRSPPPDPSPPALPAQMPSLLPGRLTHPGRLGQRAFSGRGPQSGAGGPRGLRVLRASRV